MTSDWVNPAQGFTREGLQPPLTDSGTSDPSRDPGRDVMAVAQTGTGKTAGFTLPLLERLRHGRRATRRQVRVLVLTPTRELAAQVLENVRAYSRHLPLRSDVVFGGQDQSTNCPPSRWG